MSRCPECGDAGTVLVYVLPLDCFGCPQDVLERPCPACDAGDAEAEHRIGLPEFDAMSRAALAPAPVTAEDFLPHPTSPRTETELGGPTVSHRGDADADAEGRPASAVDLSDLNAEQGQPRPHSRSERDEMRGFGPVVAASPVVLGTGEAHSLQDTTRRKRAA